MASVPFMIDRLSGFLDGDPNFLRKIGNLETRLLKYDIIDKKIEAPVFISGLARSGSTILLEILNTHPEFCSFQYKDYPFVHCATFWDFINKFIPRPPSKKVERAHKDRLMINEKSPEALDEILWMSFFDNLHDPSVSNILDKRTHDENFEVFFDNTLKKLLTLRKATRYVSKNNANSARLEYLCKLYPDACFIIPVRKPIEHIYSLVKQHNLIRKQQENDARGQRYMRRNGHFEFGIDFRPLNFNNSEENAQIMSHWNDGDIISAYAYYWSATYAHIFHTVQSNPHLQKRALYIRYDDLCENTEETLEEITYFCNITDCKQDLIKTWKDKISAPDYYKIDFSDQQIKTIETITQSTAQKFWA